jgi:alkylation response protein AidB-like acyl-CoA dehydrogenase
VASIRTAAAKKDGDDYVISGSKMWITNWHAGRLDVLPGQHQ